MAGRAETLPEKFAVGLVNDKVSKGRENVLTVFNLGAEVATGVIDTNGNKTQVEIVESGRKNLSAPLVLGSIETSTTRE